MPEPSLLDALAEVVGQDHLSVTEVDRTTYSTDMWPRTQIWRLQGDPGRHLPDAIVQPASEDEVAALVRTCARLGVPLVPYGGGSGVCGGTIPTHGGVVVDLKRLGRIAPIDPASGVVRAQAGVYGEVLERTLQAKGLTLGHFPSSIYCSTVGGWVATRSAGQFSSRYGKIEDMVLEARFIDGTGTLRTTGDTAGRLPLLPLLVGSEGLLGILTEATLRVHERPEHTAYRGFEAPNVRAGVDLLRRLMHQGHPPLVLRLYDPLDTLISGLHHAKAPAAPEERPSAAERLVDRLRQRLLPRAKEVARDLEGALFTFALRHPTASNRLARLARESCLVIVGYDGTPRATERAMSTARALAEECGARDLGEGPGLKWERKRHHVSFRQATVFKVGACVDTMEVATSWDNLLRLYDHVTRALAPLAVVMAHFSHAYPEGCSIYFTFSVRDTDPHRLEARYAEIWRTAMAQVGELKGILSHHHGVGLSKRERMPAEIGAGVNLIRQVKSVLDPHGILNPGKLIP